MIHVSQYPVFVEPLAEHLGGGFVSYAPELAGCVADGETPEEALNAIYDAIGCWLEGAEEMSEPIPVPQVKLEASA
jgi:antitoxin HicB